MYGKEALGRISELFYIIEQRKSEDNSPPTYRDTADLREMSDIILSVSLDTEKVLDEKIPVLWYLAHSYERMWRYAISAKYYKELVRCHVALMKLRRYSDEEQVGFDEALYSALKARNKYQDDPCEDILELISDVVPRQKALKTLADVQKYCRRLPQYDPIELTDEYLAVIDEVEKRIEENRTMDWCIEEWNLKFEYLSEYGIFWRSPVILNPGTMFD